jgi:hypothetical protein
VSMDALNTPAPTPTPEAAGFELYADVPAPKLVSILLSRHYRPMGAYEVVGHWKPAVEVKNAAGKMVEISPATVVEGEPMPPPIAGVGSESLKLWAGTVVRLPSEEAKRARRLEIGTVEIDD